MAYQNAIWDFDGTLYDTYPVMLKALVAVYQQQQVPVDQDALYKAIKQTSIKQVLRALADKTGTAFVTLDQQYHQLEAKIQIAPQPYPGATAILERISQDGHNFLMTHRDTAAQKYLAEQHLDQYFTEIVTSQNGFARKPAPDSLNYLCDRYQLDKTKTVMIGDRVLDIEAGINAGLQTVYFDIDRLPIAAPSTVTITDLTMLVDYFNE